MKTLALYGLICLAIQKGVVLTSSLLDVNLESARALDSNLDKQLLTLANYPIELQFKCLNDSGDVIKESEKSSNNYGYVTELFNFGHTKITVSLWNFSYIIFGGLAMFLIIFLLVLRIDK